MNTKSTIDNSTDADESINESAEQNSETKSNLIKLQDAADVEANGGKDINRKITILDADLALMREELSSINYSVEEGLDRLGDNDIDLRAKVSETYKRLGEIDNAYKALLEISARIDGDINRLNGDVSVVAEKSAEGIKSLELSNLEHSHELARKNEQVASRVNELVSTSRVTKELFDEKIKSTADNIQTIEKALVEKINTLAEATSEQDQRIEQQVEQTQARIIKLQSVDEAIIRRATTLEITSAELTAKGESFEQSIDALDASTQSLDSRLETLRQKHAELSQVVASNTDMIGVLRTKGDELADRLAALAGLEKKHFTGITAGLLILLLAVAGVYYMQQDQFAANDERFVTHSEQVGTEIVGLKSQVDNDIVGLKTQVDGLTAERDALKQELAVVKGELNTVGDRVDSVSARYDITSMFSQIGSDNVIHGEHWIAQQPAGNYTIQLATTDTRKDLYEVAMRYNHRLKDTLSAIEVRNDAGSRFALLSGSYNSKAMAQQHLDEISSVYGWQRPVIVQMGEIQSYISGKTAAK